MIAGSRLNLQFEVFSKKVLLSSLQETANILFRNFNTNTTVNLQGSWHKDPWYGLLTWPFTYDSPQVDFELFAGVSLLQITLQLTCLQLREFLSFCTLQKGRQRPPVSAASRIFLSVPVQVPCPVPDTQLSNRTSLSWGLKCSPKHQRQGPHIRLRAPTEITSWHNQKQPRRKESYNWSVIVQHETYLFCKTQKRHMPCLVGNTWV